MSANYRTQFATTKSPEEVYAAINRVRGWWSGQIEGDTDRVDATFTYEVPRMHRSTQKIVALVPGREVEWRVVASELSFASKRDEWTGTTIRFAISTPRDGETEVAFEHVGLVPQFECYGGCSSAWELLVGGNLKRLVETGDDQPSPF